MVAFLCLITSAHQFQANFIFFFFLSHFCGSDPSRFPLHYYRYEDGLLGLADNSLAGSTSPWLGMRMGVELVGQGYYWFVIRVGGRGCKLNVFSTVIGLLGMAVNSLAGQGMDESWLGFVVG